MSTNTKIGDNRVGSIKTATELLPLFSVLALILVSVFNIGYFSNIGLHFLGLIDFTNLVYSFGLVFGGLILFANFIGAALDILLRLARDGQGVKISLKWLHAGAIVLAIGATALICLPKELRPPFFGTHAYTTFISSIVFVWAMLKSVLRYKSTRKIKFSEVILSVLTLLVADLSVGKAVSDHQVSQQSQHYTVTTKSGVMVGMNLVRSSSSGFVVAKHGTISFISKDEVKRISSESAHRTATLP